MLLKPPQLTIDLLLLSGSRERYNSWSNERRLIFISPLVHDVYEFGVEVTGNQQTSTGNFVKEFTIGTSRPDRALAGYLRNQNENRTRRDCQLAGLPCRPGDVGIPGGISGASEDRLPHPRRGIGHGQRCTRAIDMVNGVVAAGHELVSMSAERPRMARSIGI